MRVRILKPGFFKNEHLGECTPLARLLFAGLWCLADRNGVVEYRPARIRAEILPYDDCRIETLIEDLAAKGFVIKYGEDGLNYLWIPKFQEHQRPHPKEAKSSLPMPPCNYTEGRETQQPFPSDTDTDTDTDPPYPLSGNEGEFDQFWLAYPRKEDKPNALRAWKSLQPDPETLAAICVAIQRHRTSGQWLREQGRYIPLPAKYLRGRRWEDVAPKSEQGESPKERTARIHAGRARAAERAKLVKESRKEAMGE